MSRTPPKNCKLEEIELQLLLEGVFQQYGFDFREYDSAPIKRIIGKCLRKERAKTISSLQDKALHDAACMERILLALSFQVKSTARDSGFYSNFRQEVVPLLRTYPFNRLWHAGCSSVLEIYSMAMLLQEEGIYDRCQIYATDMNPATLQRAEDGIFPVASVPVYSSIYRRSGGKTSFSEYYVPGRTEAIFNASLKRNIVFAQHNLTADSSFNEFNVILCRHLLRCFNEALQRRAHKTLYESLEQFGLLALGPTDALKLSPFEACYAEFNVQNKLYRKCK
jgi:chemotaxis protein methyltransferase CheR